MHIPDGYLSPQTCAALYAGSGPFWYVALRRVKKLLHTRFLPLLSLFAAFSFVVMMFNLPLPGGTTGHAVGVGIAAIVLGPWGSVLAISSALVIQALFFGDGGITAIGANCFNMAIAGSFTAWLVYRLVAVRAALLSRRRVVAAGLAGYAAINVAAILAAIEFGIQPQLFHDAAGTPLYCPYPLAITLPAMLIGHLSFAGFAELIITAGIVSYLQRAEPSLLRLTAGSVADETAGLPERLRLRKMWAVLAALVVLTPFGIVAVGSAWGEWSADDFSRSDARSQITQASRGVAPPVTAPRGLARLSKLWNAPLAQYAPVSIGNRSLAYLSSAAIGVLLIFVMLALLPRLLRFRGGRRPSFVERTIGSLFETVQRSILAEEIARGPGLAQSLDARVKLAGTLVLILAATLIRSPLLLLFLFASALGVGLLSRIPLRFFVSYFWLPVFAFSGLVALPAVFLTPGSVVSHVPLLDWPATVQGLKTAALLLLRVETAVTLSGVLILTTAWPQVLHALRFFRVPVSAVVILGMTHRYLFLLLKNAHEMLEARQSRMLGSLPGRERRRLATASLAVLLSKTYDLSADVHAAMQSRGFHGEIYLLEEPAAGLREWLVLSLVVALAAVLVIAGR